jgi:hypothetical protein
MIRIAFARIRPEKEQRLRSWLSELMSRRNEVLETFAAEGVRHEQAFVIASDRGPLLVYVIEAENHDAAVAAYRKSTLAIDGEHRAVLNECLFERVQIEPLFDCAIMDMGSKAQ